MNNRNEAEAAEKWTELRDKLALDFANGNGAMYAYHLRGSQDCISRIAEPLLAKLHRAEERARIGEEALERIQNCYDDFGAHDKICSAALAKMKIDR